MYIDVFGQVVRIPDEVKLSAHLPFVPFLKLPNPIAKCVPRCRAAGGGPSTLHPCFLHYKLVVQVTS